jgi:Gram-negative bacterial TonB protein C-terminal
MRSTVIAVLLFGATASAQTPAIGTSLVSKPPSPESFSIASFEDDSWLIVDVQPASSDSSKVRFIQVHRACGSFRVHESDHTFENVSVQQLANSADLCASDRTLSEIISLAERKKKGSTSNFQQGIEARCGTEEVIHHLPAADSLHFATLEAAAPDMAKLWKLSSYIKQSYAKDTGNTITADGHWGDWKPAGLETSNASEQAAVELRNGDFDLIAPVPDAPWIEDKSKLSEIVPELDEATAGESNIGKVENLNQLGLEKYTEIYYPQMAKIAHLEGIVSLEVSIDPATGVVSNATARDGHALLQQAAIDSAKRWVFIHPYSGPNPVQLNVRFKLDLRCQPIIDTTSATTRKGRKKARKPKQ